MAPVVVVTGATGFVGREVVRQFQAAGWLVRTLERNWSVMPQANCVVHLVGIIVERGQNTFDRVHVELTRQVVDAARQAGINRFLHMSALGTRPGARSRYHQTKWAAEEIVRQSGLAWTIFRPSVIYGPADKSLNVLAKMVRRLPVVPVLGDGRAKIQPVAVEVVARAFVRAAHNDGSVGKTYDLCGPVAFTWNELYDKLGGARKPKLHLPLPVARVLAAIFKKLLRQPPFTRDQLLMTAEDNVGNPQPAERDLLLEQEPFAAGLRRYLA
jgi:NADH dehydrogenase